MLAAKLVAVHVGAEHAQHPDITSGGVVAGVGVHFIEDAIALHRDFSDARMIPVAPLAGADFEQPDRRSDVSQLFQCRRAGTRLAKPALCEVEVTDGGRGVADGTRQD